MPAVVDHGLAVDQHECHARGEPVRGGEGGAVGHAGGVENHNVGLQALAGAAAGL